MCTLELHHGGWFENGVYKMGKVCYLDNIIEDFLSLLDLLKIGRGLGYEVDISQVEQRLEIRCKNPEGRLELVTSDATVVEMVGHIPSNKVIVLYYSEIEDYEYDADAENCDGDLTQNGVDYIEVEAEETFENVGTKVPNEDAGAELPNEDIGAHFTIDTEGAELPNEDIGAYVTIDNEGAELPNEDEDADSEIEDSDYEFSDNEAEDRPTVGENVADEGTSHGAPGEVSSDGADTSEFDSGRETDSEGNGRKKIKLPKFKQYRRDVDLKNLEFRLGMKFANKKLLIEAIKELAIIKAREVKLIKKRQQTTILDAMDKTILSCLERIRVYVMLRMASRRSACQNWRYSVGPRIFKIIEKNKLGSSQCIPRLAGEKLYQVQASSTQMEQGSSSNTVRGRGISRGRGNVGQATADPNSLQSVTGRNGQGVLPSSHIGLGRGLPSSKLSAIRGRGLGRGMGAGRCLGRGLPSSRSTVARGRGQGGPALDNISHDNNMASI
ncbi:unnamed protein product [Prunus brigantina]